MLANKIQIILSLGSNHRAEQNIQMAEERLQRLFPAIRFSKTLINEPYTQHPLTINNEQLTINNYDYQKTDGVEAMPEVKGNSQHPTPNTQHPSLFANAIGIGNTPLPLPALNSAMKALESHLGRTPDRKRQGIIDMDIDILQYGDIKLKPDDWQRPYNIALLKEFDL